MSQPDVAALAARLEPRVNALARQVVERQRAEVPGFGRLPSGVLDVEVAATARHGIRGFLRRAQGLDEADTDVFRQRALQRAEEGVPLVPLLRAYHVGAEVLLDALTVAARPGEEAALQVLTRRQVRAVNAIVALVTEAYLAGAAEQHAAARELAWALVRGERPADVASRHGLDLAAGYLVLAVRGDDVRRLLARLTPLAGNRGLTLREEGGSLVLLPGDLDADDVAAVLAGDGGPVVGAAGPVPVDGVPAAADRARRVAAVAGRPGLHRLRDVLLEYAVAGDAAAELAALLEPLDAQPGLLTTLEAFLAGDLQRGRTARALHVHANTVDNRLDRIAAATGADPRTTRGVQLLGAALSARRAAGTAR